MSKLCRKITYRFAEVSMDYFANADLFLVSVYISSNWEYAFYTVKAIDIEHDWGKMVRYAKNLNTVMESQFLDGYDAAVKDYKEEISSCVTL
jgi:hypothetical protein